MGQFDPYLPAREGPSSVPNIRQSSTHSAHETRNIFMHCGVSALRAASSAWMIPHFKKDTLGSVVNQGSTTSSHGLLSLPPSPVLRLGFLSPGTLSFLGTSVLSAQILLAWIKSAAFLSAFPGVISFYSDRENLNQPLFRPLRNEVYATSASRSGIKTASWWKRLMKLARDCCGPCLIFERGILVRLSLQLAMN